MTNSSLLLSKMSDPRGIVDRTISFLDSFTFSKSIKFPFDSAQFRNTARIVWRTLRVGVTIPIEITYHVWYTAPVTVNPEPHIPEVDRASFQIVRGYLLSIHK